MGDGVSEMTPKNRTLEGKNWTLGGMEGQKSSKSSKIVKNRPTSFMDDPIATPFLRMNISNVRQLRSCKQKSCQALMLLIFFEV